MNSQFKDNVLMYNIVKQRTFRFSDARLSEVCIIILYAAASAYIPPRPPAPLRDLPRGPPHTKTLLSLPHTHQLACITSPGTTTLQYISGMTEYPESEHLNLIGIFPSDPLLQNGEKDIWNRAKRREEWGTKADNSLYWISTGQEKSV
jgi:hypothetical protein